MNAFASRLPMLLLLALAAAPAFAQVNALPPTRHILVFGQAHAQAVPDRFGITLNLEAVDANADTARRAVETELQAVLAALRAAGAQPNDIVATSLAIGTRERYDETLREAVFVGTAVTRSVTAQFTEQAGLQRFLASIETSKGLSVAGVSTSLSTEPALREALRMKAIESSREKAAVIAKAYGAKLAGLYSVSDVAPQTSYGITQGQWPASYRWRSGGNRGGALDRIELTASRIGAPEPAGESLAAGYVQYDDTLYAVFLLADQ